MQRVAPNLRAIFCRAGDDPSVIEELQQFRKHLFVDTLGWDLCVQGDREVDAFDTNSAVHCALYADETLVGGFRAVRTDEPYLSSVVFPQLATIREYPCRRDFWEISRFGIFSVRDSRFLAKINYALMFHFGRSRGAAAFVAIADLAYERYLRALGVKTRRYGPPQVIGTDRSGRDLVCVAGEIPLTDQANPKLSDLIALTKTMEIVDVTDVRGPVGIPA